MDALPTVKFEQCGEVAEITLCRIAKKNALKMDMVSALTEHLRNIAQSPNIKAVVLTGEGDCFSAGFDVEDAGTETPKTLAFWRERVERSIEMMLQAWKMPQPVICKVQGACLGGAFDLTLACDLIYASEDAYFGEVDVRFGGGIMFMALPWLVGMRQVKEILLTGRYLSARRAYEIGLINEVLPAESLTTRVDQILQHLCLIPSGTLSKNKAATNDVYELMGLQHAVRTSANETTFRLAAGGEFRSMVREQGASAAIGWLKSRYDAVGAFPQ